MCRVNRDYKTSDKGGFLLIMKGSVLEKWPNQDPIGEAGGLNLYGYVGNNPVNFVDPLGLLVELYSHPAGGGYSHAYLKITPDNPAAFPEIPMQTDQNGNKFFTLGGIRVGLMNT